MAGARVPELPAGELKWTKVSNTKLSAYQRVVDAFFKENASDGPHFHALVVDMKMIDDKRFNGGSRETGFNKEVYQLLIKMGRLYGDTLFHVYPDFRATANGTQELRSILNLGLHKKGDKRDWPYRRVHWRQSDQTPCIQMVDILIGAIAYRLATTWSRTHRPPSVTCRNTFSTNPQSGT